MKIFIYGPYPPPYGGVSIHVQRLIRKLNENKYYTCLYDVSKTEISSKSHHINICSKLNMVVNARDFDILHLHTSGHNLLFNIKASLMSLLNKKVIITYHNWREGSNYTNSFQNALIKKISKRINGIIAVSEKIKTSLIQLGYDENKIIVIPAFIPPTIKKEEIEKIPIEVNKFITARSPLITANAFRIDFYKNQDRYGLDMCVEMCKALKKKYPNIGLLFYLPDIGDYKYFNHIIKKISDYDLVDNFMINTKPSEFYTVLSLSDVFVRPTNLDGDAISIREAIHFNIPTIASDVCARPNGTILFKSRDMHDFIKKTADLLSNYEFKKVKLVKEYSNVDYGLKLLEYYEKVHNT